MQIGLKEIKDPVLARNGWERLIGLGTAYAVIPPMTVEIVRGLYGITRDQLQAMRELIAPWSTGSTILPIRVKNEETGKWEYQYVDFSHGFFYDTVLNPIQQVITSAEVKDDEPLIKAMVLGMAKGLDRLVEPFISESIYYAVIADLLIRGGKTRDGREIFNPREDWFGENGKLIKAIKHATYQMAPGSLAQMRRLYAAAMIPGVLLASFYIVYVVGRAYFNPKLAPKPLEEEVPSTRVIIIQMFTSVLPLSALIISVLGSILMGLATPAEAAAIGAFGGLFLAFCYKALNWTTLKQSIFLTAKTSAMVCWLFVGSWTFASIFSYLGGHSLIEHWVLALNLQPWQFLVLAQLIIFLLGWPLEWSEIVIIFVPIFLPMLDAFGVNPYFFAMLVALNLQTSFLTPPMAMSAYYLKGVAGNQIELIEIFKSIMHINNTSSQSYTINQCTTFSLFNFCVCKIIIAIRHPTSRNCIRNSIKSRNAFMSKMNVSLIYMI